jgi:hypothetical protein
MWRTMAGSSPAMTISFSIVITVLGLDPRINPVIALHVGLAGRIYAR